MKQRESGLPFDDIRNLVSSIAPLDKDASEHTSKQLEALGTVGNDTLSKLCIWFSACTGRSPLISRPLVTLFAGTHALENRLDDNASANKLLDEVTNISSGNAVINRLCAQHEMGLKIFDLALQVPVNDISLEAALDEKACAGTIAFGMEAIAGGTDLLCLASLQKTIQLSNIAIFAVLMDAETDALLALRGEHQTHEKDALIKAIELASSHKNNPLEVLRRVGGRETAALCGAILSARTEHIPLIIHGTGALAAAAVLYQMEPSSLTHVMYAADDENESLSAIVAKMGMQSILAKGMSKTPVADLILAGGLAKSACCILS